MTFNINDRSDTNIALKLEKEIESGLSRAGLLFRVFSRAKSPDSTQLKLNNKNYGNGESDKKMQDLFGVRIALYFPDDNELVQDLLKSKYAFDTRSSTIDIPSDATFGPTRCNLIFRLPEDLARQSITLSREHRIDSTFEVQLRTVFSEGWHEVEHDLRYKCQDDWDNHKDLNRAMNGFIATLETCDWAVIKLFEELSWRHYKAKEWLPMLRSKFRLRWQSQDLDQNLKELLDRDSQLSKSIFRIDRTALLSKIISNKIDLPITPSNLIYISNHFSIKSDEIKIMTPAPVLSELSDKTC